jgi:hypothetical protein
MKLRTILFIVVLLTNFVTAECGTYNSSINVEPQDFGVFIQDRIGCAAVNLLQEGVLGSILIVFFILIVVVILYGLLGRR